MNRSVAPSVLHVAALKDALELATFITNPQGKTFRVNSFDATMDLVAYTDEESGQEYCRESEDVRGWTVHTLRPVTYDR